MQISFCVFVCSKHLVRCSKCLSPQDNGFFFLVCDVCLKCKSSSVCLNQCQLNSVQNKRNVSSVPSRYYHLVSNKLCQRRISVSCCVSLCPVNCCSQMDSGHILECHMNYKCSTSICNIAKRPRRTKNLLSSMNPDGKKHRSQLSFNLRRI